MCLFCKKIISDVWSLLCLNHNLITNCKHHPRMIKNILFSEHSDFFTIQCKHLAYTHFSPWLWVHCPSSPEYSLPHALSRDKYQFIKEILNCLYLAEKWVVRCVFHLSRIPGVFLHLSHSLNWACLSGDLDCKYLVHLGTHVWKLLLDPVNSEHVTNDSNVIYCQAQKQCIHSKCNQFQVMPDLLKINLQHKWSQQCSKLSEGTRRSQVACWMNVTKCTDVKKQQQKPTCKSAPLILFLHNCKEVLKASVWGAWFKRKQLLTSRAYVYFWIQCLQRSQHQWNWFSIAPADWSVMVYSLRNLLCQMCL